MKAGAGMWIKVLKRKNHCVPGQCSDHSSHERIRLGQCFTAHVYDISALRSELLGEGGHTINEVVQSDPNLPGCSGERVLPAKSRCGTMIPQVEYTQIGCVAAPYPINDSQMRSDGVGGARQQIGSGAPDRLYRAKFLLPVGWGSGKSVPARSDCF
eukprot:sb/3473157/